MADQDPSSSRRVRQRVSGGFGHPLPVVNPFRPEIPFVTLEDRMNSSRQIYDGVLETIGDSNRRFHNDDAASGYQYLCLRGFAVQASLNPNDPLLADAFRIIDRVGWSYTVLHIQPFCPRVVREFISNMLFDADGILIRGTMYLFDPAVINMAMRTPSVENSYHWEEVVLDQAIAYLTRDRVSNWTGFTVAALAGPYKILYRVCKLNWLPGPDTDSLVQDRLRLLYAVATRERIDFGRVVYDQVVHMARRSDWDTDLIFPNLIYQILMFEKEVPLVAGDEGLIGGDDRISGA